MDEGSTVLEDTKPWTADDPVPVDTKVVDYWTGPPPALRWFFPDGQQYIEYTSFTHGQRSLYNSRVSKELTIERATGNARMKADLAGDTNILLDTAITNWYVLRAGQPVPFSKGSPGSNLSQFLAQADPVLVDDLEKAIRAANPWLNGEPTVEEIDKEIEQLQRDREDAVRREQGK